MTVISLVEHPELDWNGRINYLAAQNEVRQVEMYTADLVWAIAKQNYSSDIPMPSEVWNNRNKIDRRSGKQIITDLISKLGGE